MNALSRVTQPECFIRIFDCFITFCAKEYHAAQNFGSGKPRGGLLSKNILAAEILGDWTVQAAP